MLRAMSLLIAASVCWGTAAEGKQGRLSAELVGCWQIKHLASRSQQDLCLTEDGRVNAGWANQDEGMYSSGTYRSKGNKLTILNTDGKGGPPRPDAVNHCKFALMFKSSELTLRNCAFEGDWKRLCRDLRMDAHGIPACVQHPAN